MKSYKILDVILKIVTQPFLYFREVTMFLLAYTDLHEFNVCSSFSGQYHLTAVALRTGYFQFWKNAWTNTNDSRENEISRNVWLASPVLLGHNDDALFLSLFSSLCNIWHYGRLSFHRKTVNESIFSCTEVSGPNGNNSLSKSYKPKDLHCSYSSTRHCLSVFLHKSKCQHHLLCVYLSKQRAKKPHYMNLIPLLAWWVWFGLKSPFLNPTANGNEGGRKWGLVRSV